MRLQTSTLLISATSLAISDASLGLSDVTKVYSAASSRYTLLNSDTYIVVTVPSSIAPLSDDADALEDSLAAERARPNTQPADLETAKWRGGEPAHSPVENR